MSLAAALVLATPSFAAPAEPPITLFAKERTLWMAESDGAGARALATLPTDLGAVTSLQADRLGVTILLGAERGWSWSPLRRVPHSGAIGALTFLKLACAAGPATLTADGTSVLCATATGTAMVVQLRTGKQVTRNVAIERTSIVGTGAELRLIWADDGGVWSAAISDPANVRQLAPEPPRSGLSVSPTGERALGVYEGEARHGRRGHTVTTEPMLYGFALDGIAARRKVIRRGVAHSWSADGKWALVQDGGAACLMAATGGQYKCWKGYRGAGVSADGHWALLLGNRDEARDHGHKRGSGSQGKRSAVAKLSRTRKRADDRPEPVAIDPVRAARSNAARSGNGATGIDAIIAGIEGSADDPDSVEEPESEDFNATEDPDSSTFTGEIHLYRAALNGAFTGLPVRIESSVDGPASFIDTTP